MRRADRLFQIVQLLRGRGTTTAAALGEELGVSERTIYRDIQDLTRSGMPIQGEAGVGYALPHGFDLPPLMFTEGELSALVLGASMVQAFADEALAGEARRVLGKVQAALPPRLRPQVERTELSASTLHRADLARHLAPLRGAIGGRNLIRLDYVDGKGEVTQRIVRPLGLYFWGTAWTLAAWCELREDFRTFRPDRMGAVEVLAETFEDDPARGLDAFAARMEAARG